MVEKNNMAFGVMIGIIVFTVIITLFSVNEDVLFAPTTTDSKYFPSVGIENPDDFITTFPGGSEFYENPCQMCSSNYNNFIEGTCRPQFDSCIAWCESEFPIQPDDPEPPEGYLRCAAQCRAEERLCNAMAYAGYLACLGQYHCQPAD